MTVLKDHGTFFLECVEVDLTGYFPYIITSLK